MESSLMKRSIRELSNIEGQRVLVRVDFNVPQDAALKITDDSRMVEALPTIEYLLKHGAKVILVSHLGRPKGNVVEAMSLKPIADHLQTLLPKTTVTLANGIYSSEIETQTQTLPNSAVLLLENIRFEPGEEKNDAALAQQLAKLCDIYVNDAFGAAHRAHASTAGITQYVPISVAGFLMEKEIQALSSVVNHPVHPYTAIIGGSKVSTKISVLKNLIPKVDNLVIGGAMAFTFLKANGLNVGNSLVEDDYLTLARELQDQAKTHNCKLLLPEDVVIADGFKADAKTQVVAANQIVEGWMGLDVGPKTIATIQATIAASQLVLWNGPLGVFEMKAFETGTRQVAETVAQWTETQNGQSILGGGDTVAAIEAFAIAKSRFTHVSTGGGASLEFLEGQTLPGIAALPDATVSDAAPLAEKALTR